MESLFGVAGLRASEDRGNAGISGLIDVLYSKAQQIADLNIGFHGCPSIGAAVFGAADDTIGSEPWPTLSRQLVTDSANDKVGIFEFGSVFGGTGAAGIPTIPKKILALPRITKGNLAIGAALLLPYFTFTPVDPERVQAELYASPNLFLLNAKEVLRYYGRYTDLFNRLYVLGSSEQKVQKTFSIGGSRQKNDSHWIELLSALAFLDFVRTSSPELNECSFVGYRGGGAFEWADIPDSAAVRPALARLTRFSLAWIHLFEPDLKAARQSGRNSRIPWYVDFFSRPPMKGNLQGNIDFADILSRFCTSFLAWLCEMSADTGSLKVKLTTRDSLTSMNPNIAEQIFPIVLLEPYGTEPTFDKVWRRMCESGAHAAEYAETGFESFIGALFDNCKPLEGTRK
jgi:hypothetical protein